MGERRVVIVGAVTARIAVALAMKEIEAQVLMVDDPPPPKGLLAGLSTLTAQRSDTTQFPVLARERRKAQWKNEINGRKKP